MKKQQTKTKVHIAHNYLISPTNPLQVNLVGAGGNGSQMLTALARISQSLIALGHPGLSVRVFDDDKISAANLGRQLFAPSELGLNKAAALVNRINRFFGFNWKAVPEKFNKTVVCIQPEYQRASLTIACVDNIQARTEIEQILTKAALELVNNRDRPLYVMDLGNSRKTGQVLLGTTIDIPQPSMKKFSPIGKLPLFGEEFGDQLSGEISDSTPSCSMAEALKKQDLFINSTLVNFAASMLWSLFREGMLEYRGLYLNLKTYRSQPITIN